MNQQDRELAGTEARCNALGDLGARQTMDAEPDLAEWQAIASRLDGARPRRFVVAVPAAAVLAVALLLSSRLTLTYTTENCRSGPDRRLTVGDSGDGTVTFGDGSRFALRSATQAEIHTRAFRRGATLRLHRGHAGVSVVHRLVGRWDVLAGPFDIHVTGTRFEVAWQPEQRHFDLRVVEGEVRVSGAPLQRETNVRAGQMLDVNGETGAISLGAIPAMATVPASDKPTAKETLRPPAKTAPVAKTPRLPRLPRPANARPLLNHGSSPSEQPQLSQPSLIWTGDSVGSTGAATEEPAADVKAPGSDGVIFTAVGKRTLFLPPASDSPSHLYRDNTMLCTNVRIPALFCSGNSQTPGGGNCDWASNWGVMLAWNPRTNQAPWGDARAARISVEYQGPGGRYQLAAHRDGDPSDTLYCIDSYQSGQVVSPSDFRLDCASGGAILPDFSGVDTFALLRPSTTNRQTLKLCISSVSLY